MRLKDEQINTTAAAVNTLTKAVVFCEADRFHSDRASKCVKCVQATVVCCGSQYYFVQLLLLLRAYPYLNPATFTHATFTDILVS